MFVIRQAQLEVFEHDAREEFVGRLVAHLAMTRPQVCESLGEGATRDFVRRVVERGTKHGIDTEGGVASLADLMLQVGEDFERSPDRAWAQKLLAHPTLPGVLKIDALVARIGGQTQGRIVERS
jgi:hypothetical protein